MKTFNKTLVALAMSGAALSATAADSIVLGNPTGATNALVESGCATLTTSCLKVGAEAFAAGIDTITLSGLGYVADTTVAANSDVDRILITLGGGAQFQLNADSSLTITPTTPATGDDVTKAITAHNTVKLMNDNAVAMAATEDPVASLQSLTSLAIDIGAGTGVDLTSANSNILVRNLLVDLSSMSNGDVATVTIAGQKNVSGTYTTIDSATRNLVEIGAQLDASVTTEAEKLVNATDRMSFTTGTGDAAMQDQFVVELEDSIVEYAIADGTGNYTITVTGDFSAMDADSDGTIDTGNSVQVGSTDVTFAEDFQSFTYSASATAIDGDATGITVTFDVEFAGDIQIPVTTMSADATFAISSGAATGTFTETGLSVVDWTLEGKTGSFDYMPYASNIGQIVYVRNLSSNDASISVQATAEDGTVYGPFTLDVTATGKAVTQLAPSIATGLTAAGFSGTGKLALDITVDASSVQFYGAYNVGGADRGFVPVR